MVTMSMAATVINEHLAETVLPFSSMWSFKSYIFANNDIYIFYIQIKLLTPIVFVHVLFFTCQCRKMFVTGVKCNIIPVKMQRIWRVVLRQAWLKRPGVFLSSENESMLGKTVKNCYKPPYVIIMNVFHTLFLRNAAFNWEYGVPFWDVVWYWKMNFWYQ